MTSSSWEMIDAAKQAVGTACEATVDDVMKDRRLRDALAWNVTVPGEAAAKISNDQDSLPGDHLAATAPAAEPDRARLLVD